MAPTKLHLCDLPDFSEANRILIIENVHAHAECASLACCQPLELVIAKCVQGCFDIGLPSGKSLFQLQAERLLKLQGLAAASDLVDCNIADGARPPCIQWYIMTSSATHDATRSYLEQNEFFGLRRDQVVLFQQGVLPCLTAAGEAITSPNGSVRFPVMRHV